MPFEPLTARAPLADDQVGRSATARAHTNIALIKYWGKRDEALRLPCTSSVSMTLDRFYTQTRLSRLAPGQSSEFWLEGRLVAGRPAERVLSYVGRLQDQYGLSGPVRVESHNQVPISAGLASSSSAFAALAAAFVGAYGLAVSRQELSRLARLGSGSAARSVFGGFVKWERGADDLTSLARPLDERPGLDLHLIAVEVDDSPKPISSTEGMRRVVQTSPYYPVWVERTEEACLLMEAAIAAHDFTAIGSLAQQNALDMHALNLTARPGFTYFKPATLVALEQLDGLRSDGVECYCTMDAGPNLKILAQSGNVEEISNRLRAALPGVTMTTASFGPGVECPVVRTDAAA